jgi:hypothetical protein
VARIAIDCLNCSHHGSMAEEDLPAYGLEPRASLVTLTKRYWPKKPPTKAAYFASKASGRTWAASAMRVH